MKISLNLNQTQNPYQSGLATVRKAEMDQNKLWLSFELLHSGRSLRDNYRLYKPADIERLKVAVTAILGYAPSEFEPSQLIGRSCYLELEERPWKDGLTWMGVREVLPASSQEITSPIALAPELN